MPALPRELRETLVQLAPRLADLELIEPERCLRFGVGAEALARAIAGRLEA